MDNKMRISFKKPEPAKFENKIIHCSCDSKGARGAGIFVDFAWFTDHTQTIRVSDNPNAPSQIAQVALYGLQAGDEIWLNGLFHADSNNLQTTPDLRVTIFKNGTAIYQQLLRLDTDQGDDLVPIPVQTVDVQSTAGPATYTLAVSANVPNVEVFNEKTLTATVIRRS